MKVKFKYTKFQKIFLPLICKSEQSTKHWWCVFSLIYLFYKIRNGIKFFKIIKSFYDVKRKVLSKLMLYFYGIDVLFLRKIHCFPLWFHKSWKRTVSVALGIQKTKRKRKREKPQILKLSIKLVQEFPWHCFPGGNQSPITRIWMGTHCWSCCGKGGGPSLAQRSGTSRSCNSPSCWTWPGLC